jgi:hypothetical protein
MKSSHKNISGSTSRLFIYLTGARDPALKVTCYKLYIRVGIQVLRWTAMYSFERPKNESTIKEVIFVPLLKLFTHLKLQIVYRLNLVLNLYM